MRTTLNLQQSMVDEIMALTGQSNRSEAVRIALQAYIHQQHKQRLLDLRGKVQLGDGWKTMRPDD